MIIAYLNLSWDPHLLYSFHRSEECGPLYAFFVIHTCGVVALQPEDVKVRFLIFSRHPPGVFHLLMDAIMYLSM